MAKVTEKKGLVAGRYRLVRKLGEGGMGTVYLAKDVAAKAKPDDHVALKFLAVHLQEDGLERFRREFALLAALHHPHLVQVFDWGFDAERQRHFFTAEHVAGKSLVGFLAEKPLAEILPIFAQITGALAYIHGFGILHNDLKPSNILVSNEQVKILDFGISEDLRLAGMQATNRRPIGTPGYMAPEIILRHATSVASDLYSLGIVFYRILAGQMPFEGRSEDTVLQFTVEGKIPPLANLRKDLPRPLVLLIDRLLARDPGRRPQTAGAVLEALERSAGQPLGEPVTEQSRRLPMPRFVGRAALVDWVEEGSTEENITAPRLVFFSGPTGSGKTRFLHECGVRLQLRDRAFATTVCREAARQSFSAFGDFLRQVQSLATRDPGEISPILQRVFLESTASETPTAKDPEPSGEDQVRLFYAYVEFLRQATRRHPLVLAIDDLDQADPDTLQLMRFILKASGVRLLILATGTAGENIMLDQVLQEKAETPIDLAALPVEAVDEMLRSVFPSLDLPADVAAQIFRLTHGNPKSIVDLFQMLVKERVISWSKGHWIMGTKAEERLRKFASRDHSLAARVRDLASPTAAFLEAIAVFSEVFQVTDLAVLLPAGKPEEWLLILRESMEEGLLAADGKGGFYWTDRELREHLYRDSSKTPKKTEALRRTHQRLAEFFRSNAQAERAVGHYLLANENAVLAELCLKVAHEALSSFALARAEHYLSLARKNESSLNEFQREALDEQWFRLFGIRGETQKAIDLLRRNLGSSSPASSIPSRVLLRLRLSSLLRTQGHYTAALDEIRKGLGEINQSSKKDSSENSVLLARCLAQEGLCEYYLGKAREARAHLQEAVARAEASGDKLRIGNIKIRRGIILANFPETLAEARRDFESALALFSDVGDDLGLASAHQNLALVAGQEGQTKAQRAHLLDALRFARRAVDLGRILSTLDALAGDQFQRGELAASRLHYSEALEFARILEDAPREINLRLNLARIHGLCGEFEDALGQIKHCEARREGLENPHVRGQVMLTRFLVLVQLGDFTGSEALAKSAAEDLFRGGHALTQGAAWLIEAERCSLQNDHGGAQAAIDAAKKALAKNTPPILQAELEFSEILIAYRRSGNVSVTEHQKLEELTRIYQQLESLYPYLRTQVLAFETAPDGKVTAREVRSFYEENREPLAAFFDLSLDTLALLYRLTTRGGEPDAHTFLETGLIRLQEVSQRLSVRNRGCLLGHPRRRAVMAAFEEGRQSPQGLAREIARLRTDLTESKKLIVLLRTLQSRSDPDAMLDDAAKALLRFLEVEHLAIYLLDEGTPRLRVAMQDDQMPWVLDEQLQKRVSEKAEGILNQGKPVDLQKFSVVPLYRQEKSSEGTLADQLPYGLVISEPVQLSEAAMFEWPQILAQFLTSAEETKRQRRLSKSSSLGATHTATLIATHTSTELLQYRYTQIIGRKSEQMRAVIRLLERVTPSDVSVLLFGESGTGKELLAQILHANGPLGSKPFVAINCGALSPNLMESALFGHVKGAFTGATDDRQGLLMGANGGTVFLDEIGELSLEAQTKLLRVLQDGEIRPLGSSQVFRSKFRLISATHRDLEQLIKDGRFRQDLFYRINVVVIEVPPLRERREDIPALVDYFLAQFAQATHQSKKQITARALKKVAYHDWPGNVRQLRNLLEMLVAVVKEKKIDVRDLPPDWFAMGAESPVLPYEEALKIWRRQYFSHLLKVANGKIAKAAEYAKMRREHLHVIVKKELVGVKK